ncbi:unnamed protein product [Gordionus sp. m RMFG-2023]|uniref:large ribosomal subunit protein uL16m-like n=1 Tax=Gordionus sp. m RMFG-2023 TaxID=3053472 RepID=UPI0030E336FF
MSYNYANNFLKYISYVKFETAYFRKLFPTQIFENLVYPPNEKLAPVEKVPLFVSNQKSPKMMRKNIDIRGPELVHNKLIHQQYGIMAIHGGNLKHNHFELIRNIINRKIKEQKIFAIWRVDPPWKPVSKKSQGLRMGGGKAPIHHYVTPVKSGRIIIEVGGKVEYGEIKDWLNNLAKVLPFQAKAFSHSTMNKAISSKINLNPYSFEFIIRNRMQGCYNWLSLYDYEWLGKYH